jgi:hypothetical protein
MIFHEFTHFIRCVQQAFDERTASLRILCASSVASAACPGMTKKGLSWHENMSCLDSWVPDKIKKRIIPRKDSLPSV